MGEKWNPLPRNGAGGVADFVRASMEKQADRTQKREPDQSDSRLSVPG
jgi:hypothetical protein